MSQEEPKNWFPVIFMLFATGCFYLFLIYDYGEVVRENEFLREQNASLNESNEKMNETIEKIEDKLIKTQKPAKLQGK
jgi:hypothetical protein